MMPRPLSLLSAAAALAAVLAASPLAPVSLRCEYLENPMGVDTPQPRFYWIAAHTARGAKPLAYQVLVSTNPSAGSGDQWDTGRVASLDSTHIVYAGKPLASGQTYYWKVRYWDHTGAASPYSAVARFDMGLLSSGGWKAKWIRGGNQVRKEFSLPAAPTRARAYVTGIGYYELRINGRKVGDHVLDPAYTTYEKRILYATYDVTRHLRQGANAVGMMLGEGWYGGRAALLQLEIETAGGARTTIVTDGTWKAAQGPILEDSIYHGETYDARKETSGWDRPGFNDSAWRAVSLDDPPKGQLSSQMMPPIRVVADIPPLKMTNPRPGVYVYDLGQNLSGWMRLRVKGPAGTRVRLRHAELLYDNGMLNVENLRSARATDVYVLKGTGEEEVYEPRFTYHGFRYVELTGFPGVPTLDTLMGRVVHSDVKPTGGFACSKPLLNQVQRIILWGTKTNLHSIPTDCNQRDERMGWMADAHLAAETAMLNFDMAAFYANFLRGMRDNQDDDGSVPDTVPRARFARGPADPAWGSAYPLILHYMWERYGDRRLLEEHFDGVRKWTEFLRSKSANGIVDFVKFGDWVPIERTPGNLVSTIYYYWSAGITARVAELLGKQAEAGQYRQLAGDIAAAFHQKFYNKETASYGNGTQTSNLLPLFLEIAPKEVRGPVFQSLRHDILYKNNTHLTTGILGTKYLLPYLTAGGNADLAYDLAVQTTYPGWGYMVENGATTLWELWQNKTGPSMNSHNHPMFGSVGAWYYEALAGIRLDPQQPAYKRVIIQPSVVRDLEYASGSIETLQGAVSSRWTRLDRGLALEVAIPVGSTAEIHLPKLQLRGVEVEENGKPVWRDSKFVDGAPGIAGGKETAGAVVLEAGSGTYRFTLRGE